MRPDREEEERVRPRCEDGDPVPVDELLQRPVGERLLDPLVERDPPGSRAERHEREGRPR